MDSKHRRESGILALSAAIEAIDLAKISSIIPAEAAFGSVLVILDMIRVRGSLRPHAGRLFADAMQDSMIDEVDYVDLGLACADVCRALDRGLKERRADELNRPVLEAIKWLTTWVDGTMVGFLGEIHLPCPPITGPWQRSRERSPSGVNEA